MARVDGIYTSDVKLEPFWWEDARPMPAPLDDRHPLGPDLDVLIVGAGYSGLSAALTLSRGGREVTVLDAMNPGEAASSRNGGAVGETLRISFASITQQDFVLRP